MSIRSAIKNVAVTAGGIATGPRNTPERYGDRQRQFFDGETAAFIQKNAKYSGDFVTARVQGLDRNDPQEWTSARLRLADVVRPSAAITRRFDDYKAVLFESAEIDYLPPGTKIETMGSVWLATNPQNVSSGSGTGIVQRCNAVWNHLDYYGNVIGEPIVVENERANANDSDAQASNYITKGYFNVVCQYNDFTAQLDTNSRVILGKGAYRITGFADFQREFTEDAQSVRLLEFSLRYEEPNEELDDLENHVAEGKVFSWEIFIEGAPVLAPGMVSAFRAVSGRNKQLVDEAKTDVFYLWETSDARVASVDVHGDVTGVSEGTCSLRCSLAQNQNIWAEMELTVTADAANDRVAFLEEPPEDLRAHEECTISAAFFSGGEQTAEELKWTFGGAAAGSYATITGPRSATIYCYGYSEKPLTVTASHGDSSASTEIRLEGI